MAISKKVINETQEFIDNIFSSNSEMQVPVNIEVIVKNLEINLVNYTFDEDISGVLVINEKESTIGINHAHTPVRKRFTIAHELGHYVLHKNKDSMFIDKVLFRKKTDEYDVKDEKLETEANYFAANILMPEMIVRERFANFKKDFYDDSSIQELANIFNVSSSAMTFRLINLRLI